MRSHQCPPSRQHGVVLIVTLLLLALMAIVTFSTYNGTVLEERMAGNASNRNYAFQAAETALRDAERNLDPNPTDNQASCASPETPKCFDMEPDITTCYSIELINPDKHVYRIRARAVGERGRTTVILESNYQCK